MGSNLKEEAMKSLVRLERPDILLIQETKIKEREFLHKSKWFWGKGGGIIVSSRSTSRGLGILWDETCFEKIIVKLNWNWIFGQFLQLHTKEIVNLFNISSPVILRDKKTCWQSIKDLANEIQMDNVILAGEMNITLIQEEKRGGNIVRDPFREWVEELI